MSLSASIGNRPQDRFTTAQVNYLAETDIRPEVWNEDFSRNILPLVPIEVRIEDGGAASETPTLDHEGFVLQHHQTNVTNLADNVEASEFYRNELRDLLRAMTGADHVDMATNTVVRRARPPGEANHDSGLPVPFIHCDCSEAGVWHMLEWAYPKAPNRKIARVTVFNIWRLLSPGPTNLPLAVCDARSVAPGDVVPGDSRFMTSGISFESGFVRANANHRWFYFPNMGADEVLVFKQYDSDRRFALQCPHTAFEDRSCPPDSVPRVSIEARSACYWFAD
ncbi:CmcJ/NvfI family oxidoreductase [Paraburkholderia sediminicola]|uniref:CmcJ/NvfI family oxidoreductase n=1 Tax=Paraburkholderia sediminicola TaxID=458836 RepID=UPI0038BA9586